MQNTEIKINENNIKDFDANLYSRRLVLAEIENVINRPYELQVVLDSIVEATRQYLPASGGASICLWDKENEEYFISSSNVEGQSKTVTAQRVRKKGGATRWIIDNCQPIIMPDIRTDPFTANPLLYETHLKAYAGVPLLYEGKAMGVLYALDKNVREYSGEDVSFLFELANRASVAISKVQVYEQLRKANQMLAEHGKMLEQANRELKDFAHVISHDLKAPLYAVSGLVQWLIKDHSTNINADGQKMLKLIEKRMFQMKDLIEGILKYSGIGIVGDNYETIDLGQLICEIIEMLEKPAHIKIEIQQNMPAIIIEKIKIHQVFQNLISNAINAIDKEYGIINISYDDLGSHYKFSIKDNGVGIEESHLDKVFKMFYKNPQKKNKEASTGIGLSVVKKIIELYGGKIWCESEKGIGTTFYFTLPKKEMPKGE